MKAALALLCCLGLPSSTLAASSALEDDERRAIRAELATVLSANDAGRDRFDAEVWLATVEPRLARFLRDPQARLLLLAEVWQEAARHAIDPDLAMAVIEVESSFDRFAISSAGAQGLMQVMPFWKHELGRSEDNLTDVHTNVRYGMTILAHYLQRESGDAVRALTRYHGNVRDFSYPDRVFRAWNARWRTRDGGEVRDLLAACYQAGLDHCD
jgi:soluble lytic murein transglycosylase-like protein